MTRGAVAMFGAGLGVFAAGEFVLPNEVPAVTVALIGGVLLGLVVTPDQRATTFIVKRLLPVAIVLIGLRVSLQQIWGLGLETVALVIGCVVVGIGVALGAARTVGVPRRLATLLALGTAICGNTAIIAVAPLIRARREEIVYAAATITAFGSIAVILFPYVGHSLELDDTQFGIWAGLGVTDTSQVVATGYAYTGDAGGTAVIVKLVRNMLLGFVLVGVALFSPDAIKSAPDRAWRSRLGIPWFIWGFLAAAALGSVVALPQPALSATDNIAKVLILIVMVAVGFATRPTALRAAGMRPFIVGLVAMTVLSAVALLAVILGVGS